MTRFARAKFAQRNKKVQEASSWSELKSDGEKTDAQIPAAQNKVENEIKDTSKTNTDQSLRKIKDKKQFKPEKQKHSKKFENKHGKGPRYKSNVFSVKKTNISEIECYNCKQKGHKASDCPEPSDGKRQEFQCYNCKEMGHKAFQCPKGANESRSKHQMNKFNKKGKKEFKRFDKTSKDWKEQRSEMRRVKRQEDVQNKKVRSCRQLT